MSPPRVTQTSIGDDPYKACTVEIEGSNHVQMLIKAKQAAAVFLKEPFANLVGKAAGNARPTAFSKFQSNLNSDRVPIRWSMTVTISLDPEIVKQRREDARAVAQGALPSRPEDGE